LSRWGKRMKAKAPKKVKKVVDSTTEEKIKEAARKVFTQKGFAASRTRDIAEEAGINLALLNYYFRSKEKLFDIIMTDNIRHFMMDAKVIVSDEGTTLRAKIELIASSYIDMLIQHPDLPLFILSEIRANPEKLVQRMGFKEFLFKSSFFRQLQEASKAGQNNIKPLHYFINMLGMIVFPFVASPLLRNLAELKVEEFNMLMQERKTLIAKWIEGMLLMK